MIASLPMYDWPQHRALTDALWSLVADRLAQHGIAAPKALTRASDLRPHWLQPDLLLSQTCGLPFVRHLRGKVQLVGAVDLGLPDVPPGWYCSRIIVRSADPAKSPADLRGRIAAFNAPDSQSGAGALRHLVLPPAAGGRFFGAAIQTGAHAASVRAVADGSADVAAIDAATWELARRHLRETDGLRVLTSTAPTPGLPLITAPGMPAPVLRMAIAEALETLSAEDRTTLMFHAVLPRHDADFDIIAQWDDQASRAGFADLDGAGT